MAIVHTAGFRPRVHEESPWYAPIATLLARFDGLARFPTPEELTALYAEQSAKAGLPPLTFVASVKARKKRPRGAPVELASLYEGRILERGEVPTRVDDWHDLFNALAFIAFPRAKRALHARQYAIVKARLGPGATRLPNARTREQDALSLFDEGGLIVATGEPDAAALREADEQTLADAHAQGRAQLLPFGHALYEHMVAGLPCPLATAQLVVLPPDAGGAPYALEAVDRALARTLEDPRAFQLPSGARGCALPSLLERTFAR